MSQGTFVGDIPVVGPVLNAVAGVFQKPPTPPTLQAPNALSSTPTQGQAAQTAAQQNLQQEGQQASTSTVLGAGGGLLDTPSTTSRTLLGS